jgi:hypothetical protein
MVAITLESRNRESVFITELNMDSTVVHIKKYLADQYRHKYPNIEEGMFRVSFNGKIISDGVPLASLGSSSMRFTFDVLAEEASAAGENNREDKFSREIPMNEISTKVRVVITETNKTVEVNPEDLISNKGKLYIVKSRRKAMNLKQVAEQLREFKLSKEDLTRLFIFMFLFWTKNNTVLLILASIFILEILSKKLSSIYQNTLKNVDHVNRSFYMFFISMFLIDHSRF